MDAGDEPSSIIIDTKVTTGVPVLSKKQREEFLRRNLGRDSASEDGDNKESMPKEKRINLKS